VPNSDEDEVIAMPAHVGDWLLVRNRSASAS
jgi:hypothetical protein